MNRKNDADARREPEAPGPVPRPSRGVLRMDWHHLLFLHWAVAAEPIRAMLPPGLELDLFDGTAYVGLVPFTMTGVRPPGMPRIRALTDFHETNLRTYVRCEGHEPGVWFVSLDAASLPAVVAARTWYHLPYHWSRMRLTVHRDEEANRVRLDYTSSRRWPGPKPATCLVRAETAWHGPAAPAASGSREHFLIERYVLYTRARGRLYQGRVRHPPYQIQMAQMTTLEESLLAASGLRRPDGPVLAHYAAGVAVEADRLQRLS